MGWALSLGSFAQFTLSVVQCISRQMCWRQNAVRLSRCRSWRSLLFPTASAWSAQERRRRLPPPPLLQCLTPSLLHHGYKVLQPHAPIACSATQPHDQIGCRPCCSRPGCSKPTRCRGSYAPSASACSISRAMNASSDSPRAGAAPKCLIAAASTRGETNSPPLDRICGTRTPRCVLAQSSARDSGEHRRQGAGHKRHEAVAGNAHAECLLFLGATRCPATVAVLLQLSHKAANRMPVHPRFSGMECDNCRGNRRINTH